MAIFSKRKKDNDALPSGGAAAFNNGMTDADNMRVFASDRKLETLAVGSAQLRAANMTLQKYKEGKANLERKIVENEQWYKLRHWECMRDKKSEIQPVSAWLFNCIANKHADAMDSFPSPNILPREEGDRAQAQMLTSVIPVILDSAIMSRSIPIHGCTS